MQDIEPFYNWRHIYTAEEDEQSPFYGREYSEFEFTNLVYNYFIHPQWDEFGSKTLYCKILFTDYEAGYTIIELIGEWNDAIENDIMMIRREITDVLQSLGIRFFIFIGENVFNFHSGDDDYYADWKEELDDVNGWAVILNFPEQSKHDFLQKRLDRFIELKELEQWRTMSPEHLWLNLMQSANLPPG